MQLACRAALSSFHGEPRREVVLEVSGREVTVTNPRKVYFPEAGITKLEVVQYYLAVAEGALRGAGGRPNVLVRYADGIHGEFFFQKRAPEKRPDWVEVAEIRFPSGRTAFEVVPRDAASLAWIANLGCLELHPHPVRISDLEHPDELRVDLDPMPGIEWKQIVEVARVVQQLLGELGLVGWPKTSGSRGVHVNVRIHARWSFSQTRRAALALAREVERRVPKLATSKWWKEERRGVFLDYNQNAKDRTVASAYSVRPKPDARVSAPVTWDELFAASPATSRCARCRRASRRSATATSAWTSSPCALDAPRRATGAPGGRGPGRRAVASHTPRRPTSRRACSRRSAARPAARRPGAASPPSRSSRSAGRARRRTRCSGSSAGRLATRKPPGTSSRPTCSSTRCAAARRPGRACA
jgi:DNA ligase D-like protein (predicted polymerase)